MDLALLDERAANLGAVVNLASVDLQGWFESEGAGMAPGDLAAALREAFPATVGAYGDIAATLAADWYAQARPSGRGWSPRPVAPDGLAAAVDEALSWALTPLFVEDGDRRTTWDHLAGKVQLFVSAHDRRTVEWNAQRDPLAGRWRRQVRGDSCAFCSYMAVAVDDASQETAARKYHDRCNCQPVPVWDGDDPFEQERSDEIQAAIDEARSRLIAERDRVGYNRLPRSRRPRELALTSKNILAHMRAQGYR